MPFPQPRAESVVIAFTPRQSPLAGLSARDRIEIGQWRREALANGYDRLVIYERESGDAPEVGSFLAMYRTGDSWSSWGLTRQGGVLVAWSTKTSDPLGPFGSVAEAMTAILGTPRITASAEIVAFASAICG